MWNQFPFKKWLQVEHRVPDETLWYCASNRTIIMSDHFFVQLLQFLRDELPFVHPGPKSCPCLQIFTGNSLTHSSYFPVILPLFWNEWHIFASMEFWSRSLPARSHFTLHHSSENYRTSFHSSEQLVLPSWAALALFCATPQSHSHFSFSDTSRVLYGTLNCFSQKGQSMEPIMAQYKTLSKGGSVWNLFWRRACRRETRTRTI